MRNKITLLILTVLSICIVSGCKGKEASIYFQGLGSEYVYDRSIEFINNHGWEFSYRNKNERIIRFIPNKYDYSTRPITEPDKQVAVGSSSPLKPTELRDELVPNKTLKDEAEITITSQNNGSLATIKADYIGYNSPQNMANEYKMFVLGK